MRCIYLPNQQWFTQLALIFLIAPSAIYALENQETLTGEISSIIQKYCVDCHGPEESQAQLNLESLSRDLPLVKHRRTWLTIVDRVVGGEMPPDDAPQLSEDERDQLTSFLSDSIDRFNYEAIKNPGFESIRRLTSRELEFTLGDLFGVSVNVASKFPVDLSGTSGFDNSANTLFIQPQLLDRYISAADEAIRVALNDYPESAEQKASFDRFFHTKPKGDQEESETASRLISTFLPRAYRRPVTQAEMDTLLNRYNKARESGKSFNESMRLAVKLALISPNFIMHIGETPADSKPTRVSSIELANRLSYFLWASMPDDELLQLAASGKLHDSATLTAQVNRMIDDPRAQTLGTVFASQWLGFEDLGTRIRLDPIDNPWCTESLMASMREETAMFFVSLITDDRPVSELISADYSFMNEELASHYRIEGIEGNEMRRVTTAESVRGGVLSHGSILAITSFPYRTSPVIRGRWILTDLLGTPPPPPPPGADEIDEEIAFDETLTAREKLELHSDSPRCASCHKQIDPLGFGLENFDFFGRYRTRNRRQVIDSKGQLPNGTVFRGIDGLKEAIVTHRHDDLVHQVIRKMLSYSLGRQLEYYDEAAIIRIGKALKANEFRMKTLIKQIVLSYPFQYKQHQTEN